MERSRAVTDDPNRPVVLVDVLTEAHAAMIVAALAERGIEAHATGGLTSGLRAEAPGQVHILVRAEDAERARDALDDVQAETGD